MRPRGNIETSASGSLRVRVYAGVDVLTGRDLYLKQTVSAGPRAAQRAEQARDDLIRQVQEGRHPRTNASLQQLLERHLAATQVEPRGRETLRGYLRKHVAPLIGDTPIGSVNAEVLDSFYAELRRCRDHCDGRSPVIHCVAGDHACTRRCRRHVCKPSPSRHPFTLPGPRGQHGACYMGARTFRKHPVPIGTRWYAHAF